jgi:hypothetical protein
VKHTPTPPPHNTQPQAVAECLDLASCLRARLVCRPWVDGASASVVAALFTPTALARAGAPALARALDRMAQLDSVDVCVGPDPGRGARPDDLRDLFVEIAEARARLGDGGGGRGDGRRSSNGEARRGGGGGGGGGNGLALYAYSDCLAAGRAPRGLLDLKPARWKEAFFGGMAALGPRLDALRLGNPELLPALMPHLGALELLEL